MKRLLNLLVLSACLLVTALCVAEDQAPVVRVTATYQQYDPFMPWQRLDPGARGGFGIVIDSEHVLTCEFLVRNHTLIEVQRARSGENLNASLVIADPQIGLALIRVDDPDFAEGMLLPQLSSSTPVDSEVEIAQIDSTRAIQRGDGRIVKTIVDALPDVPYSSLQFDVLTDLNVDGSGAPVFIDEQLAGIMLSYNRGTRTGKMLDASLIKRFIDDALSDEYQGFASAGFAWQPLIDPIKRNYLNVPDEPVGVQVLSCLPGTGAESALMPNDVVLAWDGFSIDNLGFYSDPDYGRLLFPQLIKGQRRPGDRVPVKIVRDKIIQTVELELTCLDEQKDLIPDNFIELPQSYLVEGGLIIQELTGRMLLAYGGQWQTRADSRLVHLYLTRKQSPKTPGDRIVLLTSVLPDPINIGYQHLRNQIVEKVNGESVRNIKDVFRIVSRDGNVERLTLRAMGVDVVLDTEALKEANERIGNLYRIPELRRHIDQQ